MDSRKFWEVLLAKEECEDNSLLLSSSNTKKTNSFVAFYWTEQCYITMQEMMENAKRSYRENIWTAENFERFF